MNGYLEIFTPSAWNLILGGALAVLAALVVMSKCNVGDFNEQCGLVNLVALLGLLALQLEGNVRTDRGK